MDLKIQQQQHNNDDDDDNNKINKINGLSL
jgi:hypothetical protein